MELNYLSSLPQGGFNFDMCIRNKALAESATMSQPVKTMKTGTTICGVIFKVNKEIPLQRGLNSSIIAWPSELTRNLGWCRVGC
jgi:hypothetical protein